MSDLTAEDFDNWLSSQGITLTEAQKALCQALITAATDPKIKRLLRGGLGAGKTYAFTIFERYCTQRPLTDAEMTELYADMQLNNPFLNNNEETQRPQNS